jgi:PAS domain-containing protein
MEANAEELHLAAAELEMHSDELRETTDELHDVNQRLSASVARLRLANAAASIGTWELDVVHGKFHCEDQCASVLGLSPAATFNDLVSGSHADDAETLRTALERARTARSDADHADFELEFRGRYGRTGSRWISLTGRTFFEVGQSHRAPARIVGTVHDVTTRHHAEEAMREEARDVEAIQRLAHNIAGSAGLFGYASLSQEAASLSACCRTGSADDVLGAARAMSGSLEALGAGGQG